MTLKRLEKRQKGKIAVFFIDDNLAINAKRTKSLLREIIARGAQVPWVGQISINLLRDEELVSLIAQSGGKWIFVGLESIDPENLTLRELPDPVPVADLEAIGVSLLAVDRDGPVPAGAEVVRHDGWLRPRLWAGVPVLPVQRDGAGGWLALGPRTIEAAPPIPGGHPGRAEIDEREQG